VDAADGELREGAREVSADGAWLWAGEDRHPLQVHPAASTRPRPLISQEDPAKVSSSPREARAASIKHLPVNRPSHSAQLSSFHRLRSPSCLLRALLPPCLRVPVSSFEHLGSLVGREKTLSAALDLDVDPRARWLDLRA
jgi:hypothetical protein